MISDSIKLPAAAGGIAVALLLTASNACGDMVRLKSGGAIEGIITRIHNGVVCLNVGFGTTFIDSIDILSITRSNTRENKALYKGWSDQGSIKSATAHPVLLALIDRLRGLRALRFRALNRQRELERLNAEIDSLERAFAGSADDYQAISSDLGSIAEKEPDEQYRLVGRAHQYNSSIIGLRKQIEEKNEDLRRGNPALPEYLDSVAVAEQEFRSFTKKCTKKTLCDNRTVLSRIEDDFKRYKSEFKTSVTDATFVQGDHIIVPVSINGRNPVLLLLDTGASTMTLSRVLADRLGIYWRGGMKVSASLADGRTCEGYSVLLKSVAVGDFRAANIRAVVMEEPPVKGVDGLLGMSFLQRFIIRIDPANKKFVLQRIVAR